MNSQPKNTQRKKICFIVAVAGSANAFLKDHIERLSETYDVYLAGNISSEKEIKDLCLCGWHHIDIHREISLTADLKALFQLAKYFRKMKFASVHSVTPKAGLLTSLAGFLTGIKHRIHIFTGQVWATRRGASRLLLKSIDKLIATLNNHILVDGKSQRQYLIDNHVVSKNKAIVLADGSICGVNTARFCPDNNIRISKRAELNIPNDSIVFVFLGRLNRDKGIHELLHAFNELAADHKNIFLLLFGHDEEAVAKRFGDYANIHPNQNFLYYGLTSTPNEMLQAGDVFVLPTYREGFGSSVIEASCLGLPVITSDAYGVRDASIPNQTGLRCKVADEESLKAAMLYFINNPEKRIAMGQAGRQMVLDKFSSERIASEWNRFYKELIP